MMKKVVSLLLALILTLSLCTPVLAAPGDNEGDVPQQGQQENNGPQWPKGTEQCFFYEDNNKTYYSGTGLSQGAQCDLRSDIQAHTDRRNWR